MVDPLAQVVTLLQPRAPFSKFVGARGRWRIRRTSVDQPFYAAILEGGCWLTVDDHEPMRLERDDFVMIPRVHDLAATSIEPPPKRVSTMPVALGNNEYQVGEPGPPEMRMVAGHCVFDSPDASLLVSLLPQVIRVRGGRRLTTLVQFVGDEVRERRPARDVVLTRLLEVLLIEALRSSSGTSASPGLARGLADERLAVALRRMHERPTHPWTVQELAKAAALSRSAFFDRFTRAVGVAPMEYLLAWRMALAKNLLRTKSTPVAEVAERVGYSSASTFTVAFTRHVGLPPARYARQHLSAAHAG